MAVYAKLVPVVGLFLYFYILQLFKKDHQVFLEIVFLLGYLREIA